MGFRKDSWATIWQITPQSDVLTKGRISTSRKNKVTGEYETDFSGYVSFCGTLAAKKATSLRERDRIRLGDVDVTNRYNKENGQTYTNFAIFSFELPDEERHQATQVATKPAAKGNEFMSLDGITEDADLPF